ncbi:hypothetical protein HC931_12335 [Candidatus Gracilibacteria bacterium]|nr:hypothetical protein [Candidatus Gracilibacteria bacterium]NJM88496.1 hypothetical protein [Hydrococcus sp. RU_2_2]NJP22520.1 hypothetical protein [Hydrococcus sp. CRU_1_1]
MKSFACFLETLVFHTWTIQLISTLQPEGTCYQFSIHERETNKQQYYSQKCYATEAEAYLDAYFVCLRAVLDREKCPAIIVDLSTRKILSINLPAFCLLGIDAVGFETYEFTFQEQLHEQLYQELQQTGESCQPMVLRDADGKLMEIQMSAQIVAEFPKWAIFRIMVNS